MGESSATGKVVPSELVGKPKGMKLILQVRGLSGETTCKSSAEEKRLENLIDGQTSRIATSLKQRDSTKRALPTVAK